MTFPPSRARATQATIKLSSPSTKLAATAMIIIGTKFRLPVTDAWTIALDRLVEAPPIDASLACAEKEPSPGSEPTTGEAAAVSIAAARCSGPRARPSVAPRRGTEIGR